MANTQSEERTDGADISDGKYQRLLSLYDQLKKELDELKKEGEVLKTQVLQAVDREKMNKIKIFIDKQNNNT